MSQTNLRAARWDLLLAPVDSVTIQLNHPGVDLSSVPVALWVQPQGGVPSPASAAATAVLAPGDGVTTGSMDVSALTLGVDYLLALVVGSGWAMGRCVRSTLTTERQVHEVELSFAEVGLDLTLVVGPGGAGGSSLPAIVEGDAGKALVVNESEDGVEWGTVSGGGAGLSDDDPAALGAAAPGESEKASRADHVHPTPTAADVGAATAAQGAKADTAVQSVGGGPWKLWLGTESEYEAIDPKDPATFYAWTEDP